jgi:hypothetical protein
MPFALLALIHVISGLLRQVSLLDFSGGWVEVVLAVVRAGEVEHGVQLAGQRIERAWYALPVEPVVLDKAQD